MAATFFTIGKQVAPAGLSAQSEAVRRRFYDFVVEYGLKRKDWELARGLNAKGEPLPGVALRTRKNRKSAMTPSGRGDPSAPYLMPGRGLSRTRSLLTGKAHNDYAEFYWSWDMWTGDQWGKVLAAHARRGKSYDVVGLSPKGVAWVKVQAEKAWRAWIAGGKLPVAPQPAVAPKPIERVGRTNLEFATFGIGGDKESSQRAIDEGRSSGFLSAEEWAKHFRSRRPAIAPRPGQAPSVSKGASNVILQHVWSGPKPPPPTTLRKAAMPPTAPPKPKAPKAKPVPPPAYPASRVVRGYGDVSPADVRIVERIYEAYPEWVRRRLAEGGAEIAVAQKTRDALPASEFEVQAAGFPAGADWSHTNGVYNPQTRRAVACRTWVDFATGEVRAETDEGLRAVVHHETGHALDYSFADRVFAGMPSQSGPFVEAYNADVAAMDAETRRELAYYLQAAYGNGRKEVFAETFAQHFGDGGTAGFDLARAFPRAVAWLREFFGKGPT